MKDKITQEMKLQWVKASERLPEKDTRETYVCLVRKRQDGMTSIRPEYVEWYFNSFQFPVGHEEGWEVIQWLEETEPAPAPSDEVMYRVTPMDEQPEISARYAVCRPDSDTIDAFAWWSEVVGWEKGFQGYRWLKKVQTSSLLKENEELRDKLIDVQEQCNEFELKFEEKLKASSDWCKKAMEAAQQRQGVQKENEELRKENEGLKGDYEAMSYNADQYSEQLKELQSVLDETMSLKNSYAAKIERMKSQNKKPEMNYWGASQKDIEQYQEDLNKWEKEQLSQSQPQPTPQQLKELAEEILDKHIAEYNNGHRGLYTINLTYLQKEMFAAAMTEIYQTRMQGEEAGKPFSKDWWEKAQQEIETNMEAWDLEKRKRAAQSIQDLGKLIINT